MSWNIKVDGKTKDEVKKNLLGISWESVAPIKARQQIEAVLDVLPEPASDRSIEVIATGSVDETSGDVIAKLAVAYLKVTPAPVVEATPAAANTANAA